MAKVQELVKIWGRSAAAYGATGGLLVCYMCNWREVLQYVPIYNLKYKTEE